jgi:hypothetical protein
MESPAVIPRFAGKLDSPRKWWEGGGRRPARKKAIMRPVPGKGLRRWSWMKRDEAERSGTKNKNKNKKKKKKKQKKKKKKKKKKKRKKKKKGLASNCFVK